MDNFYEEVYQYLINEGIEEEEATEVVNHLYEANVHEYGLITENKGKAVLNLLKTVGMMSGILKNPAATKAVKATTKKITSGAARQGKLLTTKGTAQNFTKGRTPFTGTDPVPAASSALPKPKVSAAQAPGQMQIPGTSAKAQDLRNVTKNPNLGLPGNTQGFGGASPMPKSKPSGPPIQNAVSQSIRNLGKPPAPLPKPSASRVDKVISAVKKSALPVGVAGATGLALSGSQGSKKSEDPRRPDGSLPPYTPPRPTEDPPKFQGTGERSAEANAKKQEDAKANAEKRRKSAKNFDAAFAAARKAGKKEFTWRGKQYNTKYKGE